MSRLSNEKVFTHSQYKTDENLVVRKNYNSFLVPHFDLTEEVIKIIKKSNVSVLDTGCGNGDLLIRLRKSEFKGELKGIELSKGMLKSAIKQNKKEKLNIKFISGNVEDLPFENNSFDIVISKHVFHHLKDIQKGVDEIHRCLKNNGTLIVVLNSKDDKKKLTICEDIICKKYHLKIKHGRDVANIENIVKFLKGFNVTKVEYIKGTISKPELFPARFESFRDFYQPQPSNETWEKIMKDVDAFVKDSIKSEGKFVEKRVMGIIVAKRK